MNEEELNKYIKEEFEEIHIKILNKQYVTAGTLIRFRDACIEKGRLEQKKEELEFLKGWKCEKYIYGRGNPEINPLWKWLNDRIKQLQKEIGDDSQQPRMKQTRGGELKSDEGLHSTDNDSPADIISKEDSGDICICGHHIKDHSYDPNKLDADLECDICNCMEFKTKEDRSFLGGYAEFWDNPEDDRWDKEEEKQDDTL